MLFGVRNFIAACFDWNWNRLAHLPPTGEIPFIWKSRALSRFHWMNATRGTVEHDALVVRLLNERKPLAIRPQASVLIQKILLG
jgi:hypothetical protein